jgi:hypothetical protein
MLFSAIPTSRGAELRCELVLRLGKPEPSFEVAAAVRREGKIVDRTNTSPWGRVLARAFAVATRAATFAVGQPDLERVIREDLAEIMALREDLAFIQGRVRARSRSGSRTRRARRPAPSFGTNG